MKERLNLVVNQFECMRESGVGFVVERYQQAANALRHILWWGVCLPTTCCYQYVGLRSNIEVYQFFMCPGLGTTYRIKNYWVHLFLAGLFCHCTSVAVYIVDGRAYFGKCPTLTMFSWGGTWLPRSMIPFSAERLRLWSHFLEQTIVNVNLGQ